MKKVTIPLSELFGDCAVNLEGAKKVRTLVLMPAFFLLKTCAEADINDYIDAIELDFTGISYTTRAFMHELLGELICEFGECVYDYITYKGANRNVFRVILKSYETMPQKPNGYSCAGVPLFRRNGYRQSSGRKPLFRNRDTALN